MLTFHFTGADGRMTAAEVLTSGMVGKEVRLEFSSDWDGLMKTAVFTAGKVTRDVVDVSEVVVIPAEVLAVPMRHLYVGIYGVSQDGSVTPTIRVKGPLIEPGADPSGDEGVDPTLPVWAQLQQEIDDLKDGITGGEGSGSAQNGENGATFVPTVSADGLLSWTNDKGLENPDPVSIMGPQGETGSAGADGIDGTSVAVASVSQSTEDSGSNVVTFSDGTTLTVKNGSKGSTGAAGAAGQDGYTPIKGTDYFTDADKAEMVAEVQSAMEGVPDGWQTALEAGADAIRSAMEEAGRNKSAFLFYTDAHWTSNAQNSPRLLRYLYQHTPINKTIFGGDIVDEEPDEDTVDDRVEMAYLWNWRKRIRSLPNHHSVAGNHDDGNTTNNLFSENYVYTFLLAAEETNDAVYGGNTYYYIDDKCEQTRYLYLDTGFESLSSLSDEQSQFISNALESTPDGWHIVVVSHIWYVPDYDRYSERPVPLTGLSTSAQSVADLLDNYNASRADTDAKVEFCIGGHIHYDYVGTTDGGIPIICCETDSTHIRGGYAYDADDGLTHSAVSGVVANYTDNTVNIIRVGRGESFVVDLDNAVKEPVYTNVLDTVGYEAGYRLNSSGVATARTDRSITGFINAGLGDTVYFKNITSQTSDYGCNIAHYDSTQTAISGKSYTISADDANTTWWDDGNIKSHKIQIDGAEWVRFCFVAIDDTSIITINEAIE